MPVYVGFICLQLLWILLFEIIPIIKKGQRERGYCSWRMGAEWKGSWVYKEWGWRGANMDLWGRVQMGSGYGSRSIGHRKRGYGSRMKEQRGRGYGSRRKEGQMGRGYESRRKGVEGDGN